MPSVSMYVNERGSGSITATVAFEVLRVVAVVGMVVCTHKTGGRLLNPENAALFSAYEYTNEFMNWAW